MKKLIPLTLVLIFSLSFGKSRIYAQSKAIDSLQQALKTAKEDTNKVNVLNNLSLQYEQKYNYDTALLYASNAIQLAEKISFKNGLAFAYRKTGDIYFDQGHYSEALKNDFVALKIYEANGDKDNRADMYNNIGLAYEKIGNYPKALKNYFASLKIKEVIGDKRGIAACYNNIGNLYLSQSNYPEALKYYSAALKINEATGNQQWAAYNYGNIGNVYSYQGNYSQALKNYFALLKIGTAMGDNRLIAGSYVDIGDVYHCEQKDHEALTYYFNALKTFKSIGAKYAVALVSCHIGRAYTKINQAQKGKNWLQEGLALSKEIGAKDNIKESYKGLSSADSALGNYKEALENYKQYTIYKDSLKNEENTKMLTQTAMQYEFDKKQLADSLKNIQVKKLASEKLKKQKAYTAMGGGLVALLLVFSGLVFRNNKKLGKEKQKSEDLLLNILPFEVADELKEKGNAEAKQFDEVTVLFTDFVNFTQTAENLKPQELVQELHECFTAFDYIMERNGLEKIKTVGDAYLAVCGLPTAHADHAKRTVQAALDIRNFIEDRKQHENTFSIRIGIHSGSVVAGIVGVKKFAYDIWGDTVNIAARMEQSGEPGKVNISGTTYELIKDKFNCVYRGEIAAKNKGEMKMYFVN
jgi:class 3 adenylate cyclase